MVAYPLTLHVKGLPIPKGRARAGIKFVGGKARPHIYTPTETEDYEAGVAKYAREIMGASVPLREALFVAIRVSLPVPPSRSNIFYQEAMRGRAFPSVRPDIDNYEKIALDALNGIVWHDDGLIVDLHTCKRYAREPRISIAVCPMSRLSVLELCARFWSYIFPV